MKIAIVHYHLKPGGVTTVIGHQINAISQFGEALLIAGEPAINSYPAQIATIPGIAYDSVRTDSDSAQEIAEQIIETVHSHWPEGCDLIHIHNPTLAKNHQFSEIIKELQQKNLKVFLQIHDFAEDGRPQSYDHGPYPENCHYGVINLRDYRILTKSGLHDKGLHLIPNAVVSENHHPEDTRLSECVLYPVRAIRRKNIGEALLLSLFVPDQLPVRITLPPNSARDLESYQHWLRFVKDFQLNVEFEAGLKFSYVELFDSARFILTTSIMEGFGFSFLESWLRKKPVWGRYLKDICTEFEELGLNLAHLYHTLNIPLDWIDQNQFLEIWNTTIETVYQAYKYPFNRAVLEQAGNFLVHQKTVDFGTLPEFLQRQVLNRLISDKASLNELAQHNPVLKSAGVIPDTETLINANYKVVKKAFSLTQYTTTLKSIYGRVIEKSVRHHINKQSLLASFLTPHDFNLLKWGSGHE